LGTKLVTGVPVNGVYKLVEIDGHPTLKRSSEKATYPGRKQIFRQISQGQLIGDRLGLAAEPWGAEEIPLLTCVMKEGQRLEPPESLAQKRQRTATSVGSLPAALRQISGPHPIPVAISEPLEHLRRSLMS
jgi:nicotinate phosphoribosyltransferase